MPPDSNNAIKMEVGIEDCLHIEFEYNKSKQVPSPSRMTQLMTEDAQVPFERRDRWQDLLFARSDQDQTYGTLHHTARDDRLAAESVQRERDHHKV
jgi:hypothetical protein